MKITNSNKKGLGKKKKILIISLAVVVLLAGSAFTYVYAFNGNLFGWQKTVIVPLRDQGVKEDQVIEGGEPSGSTLPSKDGGTSTDTPSTSTPADAPEKPMIERAGGEPTVTVVASFQKASNGYCELRIAKTGSSTISKQASIVVGTTYYSCSFRVPRSELSSSAPWDATIIHRVGDAKTSSDTWKIQ